MSNAVRERVPVDVSDCYDLLKAGQAACGWSLGNEEKHSLMAEALADAMDRNRITVPEMAAALSNYVDGKVAYDAGKFISPKDMVAIYRHDLIKQKPKIVQQEVKYLQEDHKFVCDEWHQDVTQGLSDLREKGDYQWSNSVTFCEKWCGIFAKAKGKSFDTFDDQLEYMQLKIKKLAKDESKIYGVIKSNYKNLSKK